MFGIPRLLGGLVLVLAVGSAWSAEDVSRLSLEDLLKVDVAGASGYEQPLSETPSTATVITADDARRFGFRDIGEALQMARGVYISRDRTYSSLGVRGFGRPGDYNSRVLLLQDGGRANDPVYDQAMVGNESPLEMEWIKRLEFVPGPSSALYGGNALFGIANAVLWSGGDLNGTRVSLEAGSGRMARASILGGRVESNGLDWVGGLSVYQRRGDDLYFREFDVPATSNGIAHHLDGERYVKGLLKASWENWRGSVSFSTRVKNVPTAYFGTAFDVPGNFARDQSFHVDIAHRQSLSATWDQQLRLHVGHYAYDAEYPGTAAVNRDETRADWWSAEYQLRYSGWRDHAWLFGAEVRRQPRLEQRNFDISPRSDILDDKRKGGGMGVFVQDEWRLAPRWLANLGVRVDSQLSQPTMTSPRGALIYRPTEATTLKLLYGKAFRPPNAYERFYGGGGQKANPNLKPERISTRELALDVTPSSSLRFGLGRYSYTLHDLIDQEIDPADGLMVFRNQTGKVEARGWEAEVEVMLAGGWRLRANSNWQHISQPGSEPSNSPRRVSKFYLDGSPAAGWTLGLSVQGLSSRRTLVASVPGYVTGNLVLRQIENSRFGAWNVGIYNLAGKRYWDPAGQEHVQDALQSDGRQVRVGWEIGFR